MEEESFDSDLQSEDQQQNLDGIYLSVALLSGEVKIFKSDLDNEEPYFNFINTISNMTNNNSQIRSVVLNIDQGYVMIGYENGQIKKNQIFKSGNNIWTLDTINQSITKLVNFNEKFCIGAQQNGSLLIIENMYGALMQDIKLDDCQILCITTNDQHIYVSCDNNRIYHYLYHKKDQQFLQVAKNLTNQILINDMVIYNQGTRQQLITGGIKEDLLLHKLKDGYLQKQKFRILNDILFSSSYIFYCDNDILGYYYLNHITLLKIEDQSQIVLFKLKSYDTFLSITYNQNLDLIACQTNKQMKIYNTSKGKFVKKIDKFYQKILFLRKKIICYDSINNKIEFLDSQQNFKCIRKFNTEKCPNSPTQFQLSYNKTYLLISSLLEEKCSLFKISTGENICLDFLIQNKNTKYISFYQKQDNLFLIQNKLRVYDLYKKQTFVINLKQKLPVIRNVHSFVFDQEDKFKGVLFMKDQMIKMELKRNGDFEISNLQEEPIFVQLLNKESLLYFYINRDYQIRKTYKNQKTLFNENTFQLIDF